MSDTIVERDLNFLRHEIANVLMTVRGYAELIVLRKGLDPNMRRYPEQIILAVDHAARRLEQLHPSAAKASLTTPAPNSTESENRTGCIVLPGSSPAPSSAGIAADPTKTLALAKK
jgi:hypothetical protein